MKKIKILALLGTLFLTVYACSDDDGFDIDVEIPDFNFTQTVDFLPNLSSYNIFKDDLSNLVPSEDFHLLELSSVLYTDHAHKQRLVKVPNGTQITRLNEGSIEFPDSTILVKTFFYYHDERDTSLGKRIIETRLLIKENDTWNAATYVWNENQSDATLEMNGLDTQINWVNADGINFSTLYHIPDENECIACHQSNSNVIPLGTTLRNINRLVNRNGVEINQITHLQSVGVLSSFQLNQVTQIIDYQNTNESITQRARAYLAMNCAHCHNPNGWEESAEQDLDFRYETPLTQTGIEQEEDEIIEFITEGEMPFIGTTIIDQEGVDLIVEFIESL